MKWLLLALGSITVLSGLILLVLPIPLGLPLLFIGVPVVMRYSTQMRSRILRLAKRFPRTHETFSRIPAAPEHRKKDSDQSN